jgi:hypothetical protein
MAGALEAHGRSCETVLIARHDAVWRVRETVKRATPLL